MQNNIEAVVRLLQHIYNICMYAELNTKSDYCQVCGYDGEIRIIEDDNGKLIWECPRCHNRDQDKMNVVRRTCGFVTKLPHFKTVEIQRTSKRYNRMITLSQDDLQTNCFLI